MATELLLPRGKILKPKPPSRICLDMAFAVGAGPELGDKSRYRSHGAIITAAWADGHLGRCLDFNLANPDYVDIPAAHTQLNFIAEDFSMIARIEPDQVALRSTIFMRGKPNADGYSYRIDAGGQLIFLTWQVAAFQITRGNAGAIAADTWYTIGMSRAGASVRVYINGVDDVLAAGAHINPVTCARNAVIGKYGQEIAPNQYPFDGKIEFLRIFRGIALSASEHLAYHRALGSDRHPPPEPEPEPPEVIEIDKQVAASADDAHVANDDGIEFSYTDTTLRVYSYNGSGRKSVGVRFQNVNIPQGATITKAYAELYVFNDGYDDMDCIIYGNDVDDALDFDTNNLIDGRARTTANVAWAEDSLGIGWKGSNKELKTIIQEIVDRPGWVANNDMVILWIHGSADPVKYCIARSWDGAPLEAPKLHIEYES